MDATRMYKIVSGERRITVDTALRLARYFGTTAQYRMNLQDRYELEMAEEVGQEIAEKVRPHAGVGRS